MLFTTDTIQINKRIL